MNTAANKVYDAHAFHSVGTPHTPTVRGNTIAMNNISWRHHYIPEFYLKGFTNENRVFKVYDVKNNKFKGNLMDYTPKTVFFEKNGNTIGIEGEYSDFLETKFYSKVDNDAANLFGKISSSPSTEKFGITDEDMPALQYFVSVMYWRNPSNYNQISYLVESKDLIQLGAYSCDFGHPVLTKADTQSRSKRTLVPEDFGH
jgi:hypothetical protein